MKKLTCIALLFVFASNAGADEFELKQRVVGPQLEYNAQSLENYDPAWVHVKFVEGTDIVIETDDVTFKRVFVDNNGSDISAVNNIIEDALEVKPTFSGDRERFREYKVRGEARSGAVGPDLGLWFNVKFKSDRANLAKKLNQLNSVDAVEIAHGAPVCELACLTFPMTPDFTGSQTYLYDTPTGFDAPAAWAQPGGRGAGMKFIDVELGWTHNHEDFDQSKLFYVGANDSTNPSYHNHGTAVVGEVVGMNNDFGVVGFASDAEWGTVGILINDWPVVPDQFIEASEALDPGDVWLIELQMFPSGLNATPMEYVQVNYDAIWTSSFALDVVCVEAGANGSQNLDSGVFNGMFDRNVRDSGAIMVGAGTPFTRVAEGFSNYGSRMDVNGWGSQIVTTGYGDLQGGGADVQYTQSFGGTSGASPMIVGSCLCVQGIYRACTNQVLLPLDLRELLNSTGIDHLDPTREIGPRPDLAAAIAALPLTQTVEVDSFTTVRGNQMGGGLTEIADSDDTYLTYTPGITLSSMEPPVWVEFEGSFGGSSFTELSFDFECRANTPGLEQVAEVYNFSTAQYDVVDTQSAGFNNDVVVNVDLNSSIADVVDGGTGDVKSRIGWRAVGFTLLYPWTISIDSVEWVADK